MSFRQGARQFFERRGAPTPTVPTARSYVNDGLIAMWDGIENAGWGVHDSAATMWRDLIGSADIAITSGVPWTWTTNSFASNNTTQYGVVAQTAAGTPGDPICAEVCFNEFRRTTSYSFVVRFKGKFCLTTGNRICIGQGYPLFQAITTGAHTVSACPTTPAVYDNGAQLPQITGSDGWYEQNRLQIGYSGNSNYPFWGEIFSIRLYSRALTAAEIAANYAIDKARFNLP
jgi:hypothetical protein